MGEPELSGQTLQELLQRMSSPRPDPAAGSAAAVTAAMAAALVAKAARLSARHTADADELATRAQALSDRAVHLAEADSRAVASMGAEARSASRADGPGRHGGRRVPDDAVAVPRRIGELAADVVTLAGHLQARGNPRLHADAEAAHRLAAAARATAEALVRANEAVRQG